MARMNITHSSQHQIVEGERIPLIHGIGGLPRVWARVSNIVDVDKQGLVTYTSVDYTLEVNLLHG